MAQKYRVDGPNEVLGHPPGSLFEAELTEEQEAFYLDGGHLSKAAANAKVTDGDPIVTPAQQALEEEVIPDTAEEAAVLAAPAEEEAK